MAANVIENQHIAKRRRTGKTNQASPLRADMFRKSGLTYQSAVYGSDFMCQFKQKPAHARYHQPALSRGKSPFSFFNFKKPVFGKKAEDAASWNQTGRSSGDEKSGGHARSNRGFSFPVPSLMTLAVIAGTVLVSLVALNWEGLPGAPEKYVIQPAEDSEGRRNLAAYTQMPLLANIALPPVAAPDTSAASESTAAAAAPESAVTDTPIPLDLMETFKWGSYRVLRGDSVSKIAAHFGISMDAVIASNDIKNARRLREGETLRIPNIDGIPYTVKKGDNLSKIAKTYTVPLEVILDVNDLRSDTIVTGQTLFIPGAKMPREDLGKVLDERFMYPVGKRITSTFGWRISPITGERHFHAALDFAAGTGTPVKAAMDATVSTVSNNWMYGNCVILSHADGYQTMYAHLSKVLVKQGDKVIRGAKIGEAGSTGQSTGPHLHFVVFKNGKAINPLDLLR